MPLKPVAKIAGLQGEAERAIREQINALILRVEELSGSARVTTLKRSNYLASDGEYVRTIGGLNHTLPRARLENQGAEITFFIESAGTTRFSASGSTINGASSVQVTGARRVTFQSNGDGGWLADEGESVAAAAQAAASGTVTSAPPDARYHLRLADSRLPNASIATTSTEIEVSYASALVSWVLRSASVVFGKLQNVTGPTILGRNDVGAGVVEELSGAEAGHLVKKAAHVTVAISANQNDWSPTGFATCDTLFVNTSGGDYTITGFDASVFDEIPGTEFVVYLTSTGSLTFLNNSGSSLLANRLRTPSVAGSTFRISQNEAVKFRRANDIWYALPFSPLLTGQLIGNRLQRGNVITATLSGTTHNWSPANLLTADAIEITLTGNATLTGLDSTVFNVGGATASGREVIIHNVDSTDTLSLPSNSGSLSGNCFHSRGPNRTLNVRPGQSVHVRKEGNFWVARLLEGPLLTNQVLLNDTASTADARGLSMGASTILARLAAGNIIAATITQILDLIGSTRGSLTYRGAAAWSLLTPGTSGLPVVSQGAGADPIYSRLALAALPQIANAGRVWGLQVDASAPGNAVELTGLEQGENLRIDTRVDDASASGSSNSYAIDPQTNWIRFTSLTGTYTINGVDEPVNGKIIIWHVEPGATGTLVLAHNSASAGATNQRFFCPLATDLTLRSGDVAMTIFTSNRHRVVSSTAVALDEVTNTKLANMVESTIKLRAAGAGTGDPTDGTVQQVLAMLGTARAGNKIVHTGVSWILVDELLEEEFYTHDGGAGGTVFGNWNWFQPDGVNMTPNGNNARSPGNPGVVQQACAAGATVRAMARSQNDSAGDIGDILGEDIAFFRVVVRVVNPDAVADPFDDSRFGIGLALHDSSAGSAEFAGDDPNMGGEGIALLKRSVGTAEWRARVENGGTGANSATGVSTVVDEWVEAVFIQTSAGTWNIYVNGALTNTGVTGGPTATGLVPFVWQDNDHGSETRYWQIDLFQIGIRFTNPRYD